MTISNECMVVNLQIGIWVGHRLDKDASKKVTDEAGANGDAARVNKHLVPKEVLQPILTAASAMRNQFYEGTLPWKDNGDRLLTRKMYTKFIERHGELKSKFEGDVRAFLSETYPRARDQAEFRMGDLFKVDDYPEARELEDKFYVNMDIDAVTAVGDFRVKLSEDDATEVKANMEKAIKTRMSKAMLDVWERLAKVLGGFAEKLTTGKILRQEMVDNLEAIVNVLPDMNILDDPDLEEIRLRISENILGFDVQQFRKSEPTRKQVASEAQKIMGDMAGFMKAFK